MRARTVVSAFCLVTFAALCSASSQAGTATTWGSIKAQYRNGVQESARIENPGYQNNQEISCDDCNGGGYENQNYGGGLRSLPIGSAITESQVVTAARQIDAVPVAVADFQARGYIRRADLDRGQADGQASFAILAFEIPGTALNQRQPVIVVRSLTAGDNVATQVAGGNLGKDASNHLKFEYDPNDPSDPSLFVLGETDPGAGVQWSTNGGPFVVQGGGIERMAWASTYEARQHDPMTLGQHITYLTGHSPCWWGQAGAVTLAAGAANVTTGGLSTALWMATTMAGIYTTTTTMGPGTGCP